MLTKSAGIIISFLTLTFNNRSTNNLSIIMHSLLLTWHHCNIPTILIIITSSYNRYLLTSLPIVRSTRILNTTQSLPGQFMSKPCLININLLGGVDSRAKLLITTGRCMVRFNRPNSRITVILVLPSVRRDGSRILVIF
jgi:hypothetical protein